MFRKIYYDSMNKASEEQEQLLFILTELEQKIGLKNMLEIFEAVKFHLTSEDYNLTEKEVVRALLREARLIESNKNKHKIRNSLMERYLREYKRAERGELNFGPLKTTPGGVLKSAQKEMSRTTFWRFRKRLGLIGK